MTGTEINMVVIDSIEALELYESIFEVHRIEVTSLSQGENEAIFSIYGVRFHLLDQNESFGLIAPTQGTAQSIWFNILVPDIKKTYQKALDAGCTEIQPITNLPDYGISNAMFTDPFGYIWLLHEIHEEITYDERMEIWEKEKNSK